MLHLIGVVMLELRVTLRVRIERLLGHTATAHNLV